MLTDQTFPKKYWLIVNDAFFVKNINEEPKGLNINERLVYLLAYSDVWKHYYTLFILQDVYSLTDYLLLRTVLTQMGVSNQPLATIPHKRVGLGIVAYVSDPEVANNHHGENKEEFIMQIIERSLNGQ